VRSIGLGNPTATAHEHSAAICYSSSLSLILHGRFSSILHGRFSSAGDARAAIGNAYPTQPNYECSSSRILHAPPCIVLQLTDRWSRNVASKGHCVAELYALYTIALRDLYGFLDVIAFTPRGASRGEQRILFADLRSSVLRDANKL